MATHVFKFALVALWTLTMLGCGSDESDTTDTSTQNDTTASTDKQPPNSQSTPQEAFNSFKSALVKDDWREAFAYVTPDSRDMMLGGMIFGASMAAGFSEDKAKQESLEELLNEHGVDMADNDSSEPPEGGPEEAMKAMVANVKDKGACISAVMAWMNENLDQDGNQNSPADRIKKTEFGEVTIKGETATAVMTVEGQKENQPMVFTKIDSKWYFDVIASKNSAGSPE